MQFSWPPRVSRLAALGAVIVTLGATVYLFADELPSAPSLSTPQVGRDTLKELIGGGRFSAITWSGLEFGPPPTSANGVVLDIYADEGARITVETMTVDASVCEKLTISDSEIFDLIVTNNATDGNSFGYSTTTLSDISVVSTRGMGSRSHTTSTFDWAYIDGGAGAAVLTMDLQFAAFGGECKLRNLEVGTLTISNGRWGDGSGIDGTKSLVFATSTKVANVTSSGNVESGVSIR
jgi:hypothetical protein